MFCVREEEGRFSKGMRRQENESHLRVQRKRRRKSVNQGEKQSRGEKSIVRICGC